MESLGQKLRESRERRNVSLEQVARDTHISKGHLEALEEENFGMIPGETYVIGFLRNYSEYLGLNPEELVSLYRNLKIQEQPLPMDELLDRGGARVTGRLVALAVLVLALVGVGGFLLYRFVFSGRRPAEAAAETAEAPLSSPAASKGYVFQEEAVTRWFSQGDTLEVPVNGSQYRLVVAEVGDRLTLRVPGGTVELAVGEERQLDVNTDGRNDVLIRLNDLDASQLGRRANLSLYKVTKESPVQSVAGPNGAGSQNAAAAAGGGVAAGSAGSAGTPAAVAAAGSSQAGTGAAGGPAGAAAGAPDAGVVARAVGPSAAAPPPGGEAAADLVPAASLAEAEEVSAGGFGGLMEAESPSPFRLGISFRGYCLLRYQVDDEVRDERFFHKGETFAVDARNTVELWISNAGALRITVGGREVELGRPGSVATKVIRWNQDPSSGLYVLQVLDRS